jgi:hypothetical protein
MAMVAGRYPIFPESPIFSESNLASWGKHPVSRDLAILIRFSSSSLTDLYLIILIVASIPVRRLAMRFGHPEKAGRTSRRACSISPLPELFSLRLDLPERRSTWTRPRRAGGRFDGRDRRIA